MYARRNTLMTNFQLAFLSAMASVLAAGCGMEAAEPRVAVVSQELAAGAGSPPAAATREPVAAARDQPATVTTAAYTPLAVASDYAAAFPTPALPTGPALDARAAIANASDSADVEKIATLKPLATLYSGTLAAGAQQHWYWYTSGTNTFKVGFSPVGASTTIACEFQTIRTWYVQQPGGVQEFHFVIQNVSSISCAANVLLQAQAADSRWGTGRLNPGDVQGWMWNNANPLYAAHFVGMQPLGATGAGTCELEVIRSFYSQQPGGERKFIFYVKNVGSISCEGNVLLATNTNVQASWSTGTLAPGDISGWYWNNANPLNRLYVPGVSPLGAWGGNSCQLEILPTVYQQVLNPDGTSQRRYSINVKNIGAISCAGALLLNYLDT